MSTEIYVLVTVKFKKEGQDWTAKCEELGTATFGKSLADAEEKIEEAILLHLNTLENVGELENFFAEHNIKMFKHRPKRYQRLVSGPLQRGSYAYPYVFPIHKELSP